MAIMAVPSRKSIVLALALALAATVGCTSGAAAVAGDAPHAQATATAAADSSAAHGRSTAASVEVGNVSDAANNETGGMMDRFLAIGDRMAGRVFRNRANSRDDDSDEDDSSADLRAATGRKEKKSTLTCRRRDGTTYQAYHGSADNVSGGLNLVFEAESNPLCQRREFVCSGSNAPIDYQFFVESTLRRGSSPNGAAGNRRVLLDWYADGDEMEMDVEDSFDVVDIDIDNNNEDEGGAQAETRALASDSKGGGGGRNAGQSTSVNLADALVLSKNHPACLAPEIVCAKDADDFAVVRTYGQSTGGDDEDDEDDSRDSKGRYNYLSNWRKRANNNRQLEAADGSSKGVAGGDGITGQSSNTVVIDMADYDLSGRWKKVLSSTNSRCQPKDVVYRCPRDRANMPYRGKRGGFLRDMITCNAAKQDKVKNNTKRKKQNQGLSSTEVDAGYGSGYYNNYNKYDGGGGAGGDSGKGKGKGGYIMQSYHSSTSSRSRGSKGSKGTRRHLEEGVSEAWTPGNYVTRRRARDVEIKSLPIGHEACRVKTRVVYRCRGDRDRTRLRRRDGTALRDVTVSFADLRCGYGRRRSESGRFLQQMKKKRVGGRADDLNRPLAGMRRKRQSKKCPNRSVLGKCETKPG